LEIRLLRLRIESRPELCKLLLEIALRLGE